MSHRVAKALQLQLCQTAKGVFSGPLGKSAIYLFLFISLVYKKPCFHRHVIITSPVLTVSVSTDGGMYGGASLKAKRYSALKSTANELCAIFSHLEETKKIIIL